MRRPRVIVNVPPVGSPGAREVDVNGEKHALTPLGDAAFGPLYWQQPRVFHRLWRLVSERGEHLLLRGHGITRRKAIVETPQATWTLTRSWGGNATLADTEGRELATLRHGWLGRGRVDLPSGPSLLWRWHWGGAHTLEDEEGRELLRLQRWFAFFRCQAVVTLSDSMRARKDLLELLAMTFFARISAPRGHGH
jgi:hypothetical protein